MARQDSVVRQQNVAVGFEPWDDLNRRVCLTLIDLILEAHRKHKVR